MATMTGFERDGGFRVSSQNGLPRVELDFRVQVQATSKNESYEDVYNATGLPKVGEPYGFLVCSSIDLQRKPGRADLYEGRVTFSSEVSESQGSGGTGQDFDPTSDPVAWVPVYETRFERLQEVATKDKSDEAIVNSAGQPFQSGLTISRHIPIWTFYQFESATITDEDIIERHETVNETTFRGRAAKTLLLIVENSSIGFYYGKRRRLTQYSLKYNEKDWTHKRLDVGTFYWDGGVVGTNKKHFMADGVPVTGGLDGAADAAATVADTAILTFDIYAELEFNDFLRV